MPTIFVSYSHMDRKWCDPKYAYALIPWLQAALENDGVTLWYDRSDETGLRPGDPFEREILAAIDAAQFALLLVSEAFFASRFIRDVELPRIRQRADEGSLVVIPVLLEPCDWQRFDYVASRQMLPGEPTPLIDYTGSDKDWAHGRALVLKGIRRLLREPVETTRPQAGQAPATPVPPRPPLRPARRPWWLYAAGALVVLAIAAGGWWGLGPGRDSGAPEQGPPLSPPAAAPAAPAPTATFVPTAEPARAPVSAPAPAAAATQAQATASPAPAPPAPSPTAALGAIPLSPANAASIAPVYYRSASDVRSLAWMPGGGLLITAGGLVVFDPATRQERRIGDSPNAVAVTRDAEGRVLIAAASHDALVIRDADTGGEVAVLPGLKGAGPLAFSPDGTLLAAGINEAVKLLEAPGGREVDTLLGGQSYIREVVFSPDGRILAAGGSSVVLWNLPDRSQLASFRVSSSIEGLAFSPDSKLLAVGGYDGLRLYDATQVTESGPRLLRNVSEDSRPIVAWSPDGALLAWTSPPALVKLWDVAAGREAATLKGHTSGIAALAFSPDGALLATASRDGMRLWGASAGGPAPTPALPAAGPLPAPVPLPADAISAANAGRVVQIDLWEQRVNTGQTLAWSPDGAWLAAGSSPARVYDISTREARRLDTASNMGRLAAAPAPPGLDGGDGAILVAAGYYGIEVWDPASGAGLASYPEIRALASFALSPEGSLLAAGANEGVKLLATADGREIDTLLGVNSWVGCLAFSPDGTILAGGGRNIILWELADRRELANIPLDYSVSHLVFAPGGETLAAGIYTGVRLYDVPGLRLLRTIGEEAPEALALSPGGRLLAWAARATPIRLVDLSNGREVAALTGHTDTVHALAFSPDGARLASGSGDGTVRLWGVEP